jgi:multidrug efflux pump
MSSKFLQRKERSSGFGRWMDERFSALEKRYEHALQGTVKHGFMLFVVMVMAIASIWSLYHLVPNEYAPKEDRGAMYVMMSGAQGASYESNQKNMQQIESMLLESFEKGELDRVIVRVPGFGGSDGIAIVGFPDWAERDFSTFEYAAKFNKQLATVTDVRAFSILPKGLGGRGANLPVQFVLQGNTYEELAKWRDIVLERARTNPGIVSLDSDYKETYPQLMVNIDRDRAYDLGVAIGDIGKTMETMLGQRRVTTYVDRGEEYDVILEGEKADYRSPQSIDNIYVRSSTTGELIPLSNLITITENATSSRLNRYNRLRSVTITAGLANNYTLGEALDFLNNVVAEELPTEASVDYKGQSLMFIESGDSMIFIFLLALMITYLVLSAQFESFIHPFVIMLTVPLALVGALAGLQLMGLSLNIYSQIGIVMLIGLAAKNGILIVEFANQLRDAGESFEQAIIHAARQRLRPIIMTSFTTIMSSIPLILASGPGSESRLVIGVVIFAGVALSTVFTLFIVPGAYFWLCRNTSSPQTIAHQLEDLQQSENK